MTSSFELLHLPKDESSIAPYIEPYKNFRLQSLLLAPDAFASTHAREVAFPDSLWKSRLLSALANVFIARYANPPTNATPSPSSEKFLCMNAMLGPLPIPPTVLEAGTNPWTVIASTDKILADAVRPWHFRLNGVFTMPEARGKGLAKDLIKMCLDCARDFAQLKRAGEGSRSFVVSIAVEEDNIAARRLYEKCGFVGIGDVEIEGRSGGAGKRKILLYEYREGD